MALKTVMVHLGLGHPNTELLAVAAQLSTRLGVRLVGIAACQPMPMAYADGYNYGAALADCQDELASELRTAQRAFHEALQGCQAPLEWRSDTTSEGLAFYLAGQARCADLILTGAAAPDPFDTSAHHEPERAGDACRATRADRAANPAQAIVRPYRHRLERYPRSPARRHGCAAPVGAGQHRDRCGNRRSQRCCQRAWQNRRRRHLAGVARHCRTPLAVPSAGHDADQLDAVLSQHDCDLVVAGAYGHNRLQEWAFGGVTRSLLRAGRCALLSH